MCSFGLEFLLVILLYYILHLILRILILRILIFRVLEYCKAPWTSNERWRFINVFLFILFMSEQDLLLIKLTVLCCDFRS